MITITKRNMNDDRTCVNYIALCFLMLNTTCRVCVCTLRQMETAHAFPHCDRQFLQHDGLRGILGQLEVVDAGHHTGQVIVCRQRSFVGLAYNGERWVETLEA